MDVSHQRFVVVFKGSRDHYQAAIALAERGALDRLVTDFYAPLDSHLLPKRVAASLQRTSLGKRFSRELPSAMVTSLWSESLRARISSDWGFGAGDHRIGRYAGELASQHKCGILAYSYYGDAAFTAYRGDGPKILFQVHPHPKLGREILQRLVADLPFGASSVTQHELEFDEARSSRLAGEAALADRVICASEVTKRSLLYAGIAAARISVAPYGVDLKLFHPAKVKPAGKLRILFVGQLISRKGLYYLLEAWKRLRLPDAELILAGRNPDRELLAPYEGSFTLRLNPSRAELVALYQTADLFCFPSVLEGFGLVLLESLACGTPVLSTNNVGLADELEPNGAGFYVPAGDLEALSARLEWCARNRDLLAAMRAPARQLAERYTWPRFRKAVAEACLGAAAERR